MRNSLFRIVPPFLVAAVLLLQGCTYVRLVRPESQVVSVEQVNVFRSDSNRFSYSIVGMHGVSSILHEKALRDSFLAYSIVDVKKSEKLENDRVNVLIYIHPSREDKLNRYFGATWAVISVCTLSIVPLHAERIYPLEIHILTPGQEFPKQVRILQSEYVVESWTWLPLAFVPNDENKAYELGLRRVFDGIVKELAKY